MLDAFFYKSCNLSLLLHFRGDVWIAGNVLCPTNSRAMWGKADPEAMAEVYKRTPVTRLDDVPWREYDVVLTQDPIVPRRIIAAHPRTLWTYWEAEHTSGTYGHELYGYDVFWDYTLKSLTRVTGLPQALSLPFMVNIDILRGLVKLTHEDAVFVPSRMVRPHGGAYPPLFGKKTVAGLPMRHGRVWDLRQTWRAILNGEVETAKEYMSNTGSCKYLLNVRPGASIGQPIIEAAALGLIVVSTPERYATVCHPYCRVTDLTEAVRTIGRLQQAPRVQEQVLEYQDAALKEHFWDGPLNLLKKALEMKGER